MVLTYDHKHDKIEKGKLESMWYGPYIVSKFLEKGAYELVDYDGIPFETSQWVLPEKVLCLSYLLR